MRPAKRIAILAACCIMPLLLGGCATIASCPGNLLPIVEIQVNNTASNHDDYGTTAAATTPARARITNPTNFNNQANFPNGVAVEIRNAAGFSNLAFAANAGGAGSASIFTTLPGGGGWANFFVRGTGTSTVDKSAIIEMATSGICDEAVLARKAMMIPSGAPPISANIAQQVEIEINQTSATLDDYVAWGPLPARVRWSNGSNGNFLNVTVQNMLGTSHLLFAGANLAGGSTATLPTLPLNLNGDGSWSDFFVAGNFNSPSSVDKDAVLEVATTNGNTILSREGMMVRIRKNANSNGFTTFERDRYLDALKKVNMTFALNNVNADYLSFVKTHSRDSSGSVGSQVAHRQAHGGSGFLPWHRAFVLHIERLLQAADPAVALPYWKFDAGAPNVFSTNMMGSNSNGNFATLAASNPISSWALTGEFNGTGIQRKTPYGDNGTPTVLSEVGTLALGGAGFTFANFKTMELTAHNPAHSSSGFVDINGNPLPGASWVAGSPAIATRDPLFFFLHSNVDRLWAKWQWLHVRNDITATSTYDLLGSHGAPAPGVPAPSINPNRTLGQYADDTMWPWDNVTGGAGTAARPNIAILTPFPIVLGGVFPLPKPAVRTMIDWAGRTSNSPGTILNYGYDDFNPFQ